MATPLRNAAKDKDERRLSEMLRPRRFKDSKNVEDVGSSSTSAVTTSDCPVKSQSGFAACTRSSEEIPLIVKQQSLWYQYDSGKSKVKELEEELAVLRQKKDESACKIKKLGVHKDQKLADEIKFLGESKGTSARRSAVAQMRALSLHSHFGVEYEAQIQEEKNKITSYGQRINCIVKDISDVKEHLAFIKPQLPKEPPLSYAKVVKKQSVEQCVKMEKRKSCSDTKRHLAPPLSDVQEHLAFMKPQPTKEPPRFYAEVVKKQYSVNQCMNMEKWRSCSEAKSQLAPPLLELMKMLFNVETYRKAMMDFKINMSEMPLGKLTRSNIRKGFQVLTEMQSLLNCNSDSSVSESALANASNRFFTAIPSIHPHVIRGEDEFMSKVKMLEALQEIEVASKLVGFSDDESFYDKYKKLQCDIIPLPHDSDDYILVEKYFLTNHAPTQFHWTMELEDVFSLQREGEVDNFVPYKKSLNNVKLLWHGARLTSFVGILSKGLRKAPAEAPATCYMFGKGIYFADLVSKSALDCCTNTENPVGLMLLSEVALGDVYELQKASYVDKLPKGKHSTKGLGKSVPRESEHVKWRDDVVVPCGQPVASSVTASGLIYNEYIVYDTAQVRLRYLLKVRFHHKR